MNEEEIGLAHKPQEANNRVAEGIFEREQEERQ